MTLGDGSAQRVLVLLSDDLGSRLAGPGIRALAIARVLRADGHQVTLATLGDVEQGFDAVELRGDVARRLVDASDVVVVSGPIFTLMPWLGDRPQPIVVDLYNPFHVELLGQAAARDIEVDPDALASVTADIAAQLGRADLVLASNERQRDLWLGQLAGLGRLRPDGELDGLVRLAPFGVDASPAATEGAIRGTHGVGEDDVLLLWAGGIHDWFDPLTLIDAISIASATDSRVKLFFLSSSGPDGRIDPASTAARARRHAAELGLDGSHVIFNERWVDYEARAAYLVDADIGVTTHALSLETRFSHRTRNLDYFWAGLPIIATEGDVFAEIIERTQSGVVVPERDAHALAAAILELAVDPVRRAELAEHSRTVGESLHWEQTLGELREFVARPHRSSVPPVLGAAVGPGRGVASLAGTALRALRAGGPGRVLQLLRDRRRRRSLG